MWVWILPPGTSRRLTWADRARHSQLTSLRPARTHARTHTHTHTHTHVHVRQKAHLHREMKETGSVIDNPSICMIKSFTEGCREFHFFRGLSAFLTWMVHPGNIFSRATLADPTCTVWLLRHQQGLGFGGIGFFGCVAWIIFQGEGERGRTTCNTGPARHPGQDMVN